MTCKGACLYTDIGVLSFRQKLIWFHRYRHECWQLGELSKGNHLVKTYNITKGTTSKLLLLDYRIQRSFCCSFIQNELPFPIQVIATDIRNSSTVDA